MNNRRHAAQRLVEEMANAGVPPCGDQVPSLEEDANDDKDTTNLPTLTFENIRVALIQIDKAIKNQAQASLIKHNP